MKKGSFFVYIRDMRKYLIATLLTLSFIFAKAQNGNLPPLSASDIRDSADTTIYNAVDIGAEFPGGTREFMNHLIKTIRYPADARRQHIQGKVFLQFVVEKDGVLSNIKVVRGVSPDLDAEAIRVIKSSPKWHPGLLKGVNIRQRYTLPISFALAN